MKTELLKDVNIGKYAGSCKAMQGCVVAEIESTTKALTTTEKNALANHLRKNEQSLIKQHNGEWLEIIIY